MVASDIISFAKYSQKVMLNAGKQPCLASALGKLLCRSYNDWSNHCKKTIEGSAAVAAESFSCTHPFGLGEYRLCLDAWPSTWTGTNGLDYLKLRNNLWCTKTTSRYLIVLREDEWCWWMNLLHQQWKSIFSSFMVEELRDAHKSWAMMKAIVPVYCRQTAFKTKHI